MFYPMAVFLYKNEERVPMFHPRRSRDVSFFQLTWRKGSTCLLPSMCTATQRE